MVVVMGGGGGHGGGHGHGHGHGHGALRYLDVDGDGTISFNEFLTWYTDDGMVNNLIKCYDKSVVRSHTF